MKSPEVLTAMDAEDILSVNAGLDVVAVPLPTALGQLRATTGIRLAFSRSSPSRPGVEARSR